MKIQSTANVGDAFIIELIYLEYIALIVLLFLAAHNIFYTFKKRF